MNKEERIKKIVKFVVIFDIVFIVLLCIVFKYLNYNFNNIIANIITKTGIIISLSLLLVWLINNWLWKCRYKFLNINSWFFDKMPNLNGKWEGIIINTKDENEQKANITIKQTYLSIFITTEVKRGNSITYSGDLIRVNGNNWKLIWTWHSNSTYDGREFSGTDIVDVISEKKLEGIYFTNANIDKRGCTSGSFKAEKSNKEIVL